MSKQDIVSARANDCVGQAPTQREPIAIVGVAGMFARSKDLSEYWSNILREVDCITDVPPSHWAIEDHYDSDRKAPDKTYSKRGGFLPEHEFNPLEFGLPPNILELTDVAQLLALSVASRALSDAGYGSSNPLAQRTGVILGVSALSLIGPLFARLQHPIWRRVLRSRGLPEVEIDAIIETLKKAYIEWREDSFPGYLSNVVPGRIANRLNLGGINCSVDAACASSMASIQFAMHELRNHSCDMVLAGGVDTNNSPMSFVSFSKTPAFTAHAHMRPFDAASDGILIGEGIGILALRRLKDAERDGQRIYAVIRGVGASSDGRFSSIYAPRREGQELSLRRAYEEADVLPSSVGLLEAHGTGTPAGDPIELAALQSVFGDSAGASIALGSVKSQIGHTKVAAGAASLIKAALALHEKVLPPTINVATPHPSIREPFYVNTRPRPWFSATPRRAGVSSFGFGGTNFHVVLEEHQSAKSDAPRTQSTPFALFLHASDATALAALCAQVADELNSDMGARRFRELVESSKKTTIPSDAARVGFLAMTREETITRLQEIRATLAQTGAAPREVYFRERALDVQGRLVVLFPGQGSQYVDMGASLCANFPPFHDAFAKMDAVRAEHQLPSISEFAYPPPVFGKSAQDEQTQKLRATNNAQAAIGACNFGLFELLRRCGCKADYFAGHSLGELSALYAGGALSERDYLSLLVARGEAMAKPPPSGVDPGTLLAIGGDVATIEDFLRDHPGVTIANRNSRSQLVVAGSKDELSELKAALAALGITATLLPVSGAFHSHRVEHAQAPFAQAIDGIQLSAPKTTTFANTTGAPYPSSEDEVRRLLAEQLLRPVEFCKEIEAIYDAGGRIFVECGPGRVLTGLVGSILNDKPHFAIALNRTKPNDDLSLRDAYVQLRVAGVELTDLDPWQSLPDVSEKSGSTVRLSGTSYKSERTQLAFEEALKSVPEEPMTKSETKINLENTATMTGDFAQAHLRYLENLDDSSAKYFELTQKLYTLATNPACSPAALASFERAMNNFHEFQMMAQQVHAQFLQQPIEGESTPRRAKTASEHTEPVAIQRPAPEPAPQPKPAEPAAIQKPAPEPQRPAARPVTNGTNWAALTSHATSKPESNSAAPRPVLPAPTPKPEMKAAPIAAPRTAAPAPVASGGAHSADEIAKILLAVISEKTGYPLHTLTVSMDVDADLGIDSLKRVEIMAALEGRLFKSLSGIDFSSFSSMRTIAEIARFLAEVR